MPEPESDIEQHATASKRKASEMEFEIPSAKRTGPVAGDSVTESDSDSYDVLLPSRRAPAVVSNIRACRIGPPRRSTPADDSVTESESDDELPTNPVQCFFGTLLSRIDDFTSHKLRMPSLST